MMTAVGTKPATASENAKASSKDKNQQTTSTHYAEQRQTLHKLDIVDHETFDQILEMDEGDPEHPFTQEMVDNFFTQAEETFQKMDDAVSKEDLAALSRLGHFLKGSSAALGLLRLRRSCELIQHYGNGKDADGTTPLETNDAKERLPDMMALAREEFKNAADYLEEFLAQL